MFLKRVIALFYLLIEPDLEHTITVHLNSFCGDNFTAETDLFFWQFLDYVWDAEFDSVGDFVSFFFQMWLPDLIINSWRRNG